MPWLIPSVIATATGTAILTTCYCYLYALDRKNFLKIWAISWAVYFTRYVFLLITLFWQKSPWLLIANQMASLVSGVLLLYGTYLFINKKFPRIFLFLAVAGGLWIIVSILNNYSFLVMSLPTFSFLAGIYVWTGIVFLQSSQTEKKEIFVVGIGFILWGIHKADYPFLHPVVWFAPWGYLLAAALELTVALGLMMVYFRKARNEMAASEKKFRSLAENSRDYIMRYDRQGRHTYMNPAALAVTGLSEADMIGKTHREAGFPEDLCVMWEEQISQVFATGKPRQTEFSWESTTGSVYLDWRLAPELDDEGRVFSVLGVSRDITDRRQLEKVQTFLAETSSGTATEPFFYAMARFLAENLTMDFVCIDRLEGDGLTARTVAVWHDGHFEDNVRYALKDTPCGEVVGQQICCYAASVSQLFPKDQVLQDLQAESYAGVTLFSHTGQPIGLIAIISRQPLGDRQLVEETLKMAAVRAAGEMERLDAEGALKASEQLLGDIALNIPGALYQFVRNPDGSFAVPYMSDGGSLILGQPPEVLLDVSRLFTNVHPDDLPGFYASISESAEALAEWRQEFRVLMPTGEIRWLLGISRPNRLDNGGICWNGVLLDITGRKQAEEALTRATEMLELTGAIAKVGGWELDLVSHKMIFSRTALLINEVDPNAELSIAQAYAMIHPDDRAAYQATVESTLSNGTSWDRELRMTTAKGRSIWARVQGVVVMENGRAIKLYGTFQDITERKLAEIALQTALAEKEVLLREVHHRVKNNLAAIIGLFDLQHQTLDDPQAKTALQELSSRVRAMSLVHEKLYHAESLARIDFQNYLESLVAQLSSSFAAEGIQHEIVAQGVEVPLDLAVPCGMIINELIINAFKYAFPKERRTPGQDAARIVVTMRHDNGTFSLSVADNGVGLPGGFALGETETLGLTLVRMLGEHQLGGRYEIDQTSGTRFTLTFTLRNGRKTHA